MHALQSFVALIGRLCLSLVFILSAVHKILDWQSAEAGIVNALSEWSNYLQGYENVQLAIQQLIFWAPGLVAVAFAFEMLGGILVLLGIRVRFGALLLMAFLIPATLLFHRFWVLQGPDRDMQMIMFLKNLAIFGGLTILLAQGNDSRSSASSG